MVLGWPMHYAVVDSSSAGACAPRWVPLAKISVLKSMEVGINFDTAERAMDLSLLSTFETKEDLNTYNTHSEHVKVVNEIKKVITSSKVVDYIK